MDRQLLLRLCVPVVFSLATACGGGSSPESINSGGSITGSAGSDSSAGGDSSGGGGSGGNSGGGSNGGGSGGSGSGDGSGSGGDSGGGSDTAETRHRYSMNNQCFALRSVRNGNYVAASGAGFTASESSIGTAMPFFFKPSSLGSYLLFTTNREVVTANASTTVNVASASATDLSIWTVTGVDASGTQDSTSYPQSPQYHTEPTPELIAAYRGFVDPLFQAASFVFSSSTGNNLAVNDAGFVGVAAASNSEAERFIVEATTGCETFPEAMDNTVGDTFKGTTDDGRVLGMVDAHVHVSATEFLGRAQWGRPFHPFGVEHAIGSCEPYHGQNGMEDALGGIFEMDVDGHATDGYPLFTEWPARGALTHEAIYWKWLERSWKAGLRVIVNDLVDNETLCEITRNSSRNQGLDCNSMNNAGRQAGTMYAMQDYIDAQYGGRGEGWFQIVFDPTEARARIEEGKAAVVLGIEISNFLNCKVIYNPLSTEEAFEETGEGGANRNEYTCRSTETGADDEILTQIERMMGWGVRQVITIHEFDNAFGGNGIFDGLILNLGNRENSGGLPVGFTNPTTALFDTVVGTNATGEFWSTYTCPNEGEGDFSGYLFSNSGGTSITNIGPPPPVCQPMGQGGRPGGPTACYPAENQCNARWMTPIGLYTYGKIMEKGLIFDIDHLEMAMKTQMLEFSEAQAVAYPFVSTHGNFGGTTIDQAERILRNGGMIYPSLGNGPQHINRMTELLGVHQSSGSNFLFGFGFGTDTNGLSAQSGPRGNIEAGKEVRYPYTLFSGAIFDELEEFDNITGVQFDQPSSFDHQGNGRTWHLDIDGSAHHGMLSGMVQEMRLEGSPEQMRHLFNSAEVYLRMWEKTLESQAAINRDGLVVPNTILREAPGGPNNEPLSFR